MIGLLLAAVASLIEEISLSIGKWESTRGKETPLVFGFLNYFWMTLLFLVFAFLIPVGFFAPGFPSGFVFNPASLPTLATRCVLEILQSVATVYAVMRADRSTSGFLGVITIPLLLIVDLSFSYTIRAPQLAGMGLIVASLVLIFVSHGLRRAGAWLVVFTSVNAVFTISLFKYDVSHYNSIEAEQAITCLVLLIFFFIAALISTKRNPLRFLSRPVFFAQSLLMGIGGMTISFAYGLGTASVVTTAKRALNILFAMLSGRIYFHESKIWIKLSAFLLIVAGLILLIK